MTGYQPTPNVLQIALGKIAGREAAFVADCAGGRARWRIARTFDLSFEQLDALETHFALRINEWRGRPAVAPIDRSLPTGDRE